MISYKKFQKLLIDKSVKKSEIQKRVNLSSATMAKLNSDKIVSLTVIEKLCKELNCQPGDLMEYIKDSE